MSFCNYSFTGLRDPLQGSFFEPFFQNEKNFLFHFQKRFEKGHNKKTHFEKNRFKKKDRLIVRNGNQLIVFTFLQACELERFGKERFKSPNRN